MDKLKVKIDLMNATQAINTLEAAIEANDHRTIGAQLWHIRQALENLQTDTGVKLEFMNLKADPPAIDITKYSHAWKHAPKGSAAHWQCAKCGELDNNAIPDTGYSCSEADPPAA